MVYYCLPFHTCHYLFRYLQLCYHYWPLLNLPWFVYDNFGMRTSDWWVPNCVKLGITQRWDLVSGCEWPLSKATWAVQQRNYEVQTWNNFHITGDGRLRFLPLLRASLPNLSKLLPLFKPPPYCCTLPLSQPLSVLLTSLVWSNNEVALSAVRRNDQHSLC